MTLQAARKTPVPRAEKAKTVVLGIDLTVIQQQANWCWAACVSVAANFRGHAMSQCDVAGTAAPLKGTNCCATPGQCDVGLSDTEITPLFPAPSAAVLSGNYALASHMRHELSAGRPLGAGIRWLTTVGGHMLLASCDSRNLLDATTFLVSSWGPFIASIGHTF